MLEIILQRNSRDFLVQYAIALENLRKQSNPKKFKILKLQQKALALGIFLRRNKGTTDVLKVHPLIASILKKGDKCLFLKSGIISLDLVNTLWSLYENNYDELVSFNGHLSRINLKTLMKGYKIFNYTPDNNADVSRRLIAQIHAYKHLVGLPLKADYSNTLGLNALEKHQFSALLSILFSGAAIFVTLFWVLKHYSSLDVAWITLSSILCGLLVAMAELVLYYRLLFQ